MNMKQNNAKRDVRTLLFGKIAPAIHKETGDQYKDHDTLYQQIYQVGQIGAASAPDAACTFLTFGGYDALCVYPPKIDETKPHEWLYDIYEDKQRIIQMPSNDIIYHQMHVVSEHPDTPSFWSAQDDMEYPFFLATLIYGVDTSRLAEALEKYRGRHRGRTWNLDDFGSSRYEQLIRLHMDEHCNEYSDKVKYVIYNGITVADVVVLWRAKTLDAALQALARIEYSGVARKTLTTLGFPMDANGRIKRCVMDNLVSNMEQSITVSIQGSVRDFGKYNAMRGLLVSELPESTSANIKTLCRKFTGALEGVTGGVTDGFQRLAAELAEEAANAPENFTEALREKIADLSAEVARQPASFCDEIRQIVDELEKEALEQSCNNVDKIKQTIREWKSKALEDNESLTKMRKVLFNGKRLFDLEEAHRIAKISGNLEGNLELFLPHIYRELCCGIPDRGWMQSLGKSDFSASARVSYANLANLLELYRKHHRELSTFCWELLTDVKSEDLKLSGNWIHESKRPADVLCKLYTDFQEICPKDGERQPAEGKLDLRQFPWFSALQELLGTHHYIDHHPVLHGPAYLVYTSLKIAYSYFAGQIPDYQTVEKRRQLLKRSEENIINFIRNLDQLTEQISRNDDAMLNNRSNTHTIHFSLPESALEFYHAFLRRIVNYLIQFDRDSGLIPEGFEYDFLLSPKICSSYRFRPMLRTEHKDHDYQAGMVWPQKQAYILELPMESIFNPIDIFVHFIHESFHCFGDTLRQRPIRKQFMALFIASNLLNVVGMNQPEYQNLCAAIARTICQTDWKKRDSYLTTSWEQLVRNTEQLVKEDSLEVLFEKFKGAVKEETLLRWLSSKEKLQRIEKKRSSFAERMTVTDAILKNCYAYFKECYADAMTIALLRLSPEEYLESSRDELRRFHYKYYPLSIPEEVAQRISVQRSHLAQRFAIVLATCCKVEQENRGDSRPWFTKEDCVSAIRQYAQPPKNRHQIAMFDPTDGYSAFSETLLENFNSLVDPSIPMPDASSLHPPATLQHVIDYLIDSIQLMYSKDTKLPMQAGCYDRKSLVTDFNEIIRNGNMFGQSFYDMIYSHHKEIRDSAGVES